MTKEELEQELQHTRSKLEKAEIRNTTLQMRLRIAHKVASVVLDELAPLPEDNQLRQYIGLDPLRDLRGAKAPTQTYPDKEPLKKKKS